MQLRLSQMLHRLLRERKNNQQKQLVSQTLGHQWYLLVKQQRHRLQSKFPRIVSFHIVSVHPCNYLVVVLVVWRSTVDDTVKTKAVLLSDSTSCVVSMDRFARFFGALTYLSWFSWWLAKLKRVGIDSCLARGPLFNHLRWICYYTLTV